MSSAPSSGGNGSAPRRGSRAVPRRTAPSSVIVPSCPLFRPAGDDIPIRGSCAATRLVPLGRTAPRRHRMIALSLALAASHGMVDRIHDSPAHRGPETLPADSSRLADRDILVIQVPDLPDRRHAVELYLPDLARRQLDVGVIAFLGQKLRERPRAPAQLTALAGLKLDVVHERSKRNVADGQRVPGKDVRLRSRHQRVPWLHAQRGDDVPLLAVAIMQERDARRPIRIVLDAGNDSRDPEFLAAEIDLPEHALVPATPMAHGDAAVGVATTAPALRPEQTLLRRLLRDLLAGDERHVPAGR